jgi:hypothetical protein
MTIQPGNSFPGCAAALINRLPSRAGGVLSYYGYNESTARKSPQIR